MGLGLVLAGMTSACVTTEQANEAIQSQWIGQPSDVFFSNYGPPVSRYALDSGGAIYTWRGGETSRTIAPVYRAMTPQELEAQKYGPRTVINVGGGYYNPNPNPAPPGQVLVTPGRVEQLTCEAQITTDTNGIITNIRATRDTDGYGLAFSRCAEVFNVSG